MRFTISISERSGKTTFSKRLAVQLLANGMRPIAVGMDDYFVNRDLTPRDEKGSYDFEVLGALDLKRFNEDLVALMDGREAPEGGARPEGGPPPSPPKE